MALERQKQKVLQAAERLLKQGKVDQAIATLERASLSGPGDLLMLNRLADLLAKQGRPAEAIRYYLKIAEEFTNAGFYPKAIAIHKKILRLDSEDVHALAQLGYLYLEQRLPGEASKYLLHAAEVSLQAKDFSTARAVYERLIEADPGDPRHRARLAETRAAEGDTEQAGQELLLLGESLFTQGKPGDAEQTFRRAAELLPGESEPLLRICRAVTEQGRGSEALELLEAEVAKADPPPTLIGELGLQYAISDREEEAIEVLRRPEAEQMPGETLLRLFRHHLDKGKVDRFWEQMDPVFEAWAERGSPERLEAIFGRLSTLEEPGHLPALQRLYDLTKKTGDKTGMSRTLESLVRTYRARSLNEEADEALDRLKEIAPHSSLIASASGPAEQEAATASAAPEQAAESNETPAPSSADEAMPVDVEAPAVPLNRSDEEFVAGRLTQAEILEKYGLLDQAMEQVREVTLKFPGHVPAQERRLALLRTGTDRRQTGDALVGLALARRAQGDTEGARQVAAEADQMEAVSAPMRARLARLGLLEDGAAPAAAPAPVVLDEPAPAPAVEADSAPAAPVVVETAAGEAPVSGPPPTRAQEPGDAPAPVVAKDAEQGSVLIDFDALEGEQEAAPVEEAPPAEPAAAPPAPPTAAQPPTAGAKMVRPPGEDMLEEIRLQLQGGMADEASRRVKTLRALGYGSDELDLLEKQIGEAVAAAPVAQPAPAVESEVSTESSTVEVAAEPDAEQVEALAAVVADREDDDDLSTITAALESELFSEEVEAPVPEAQTEQSLEDVFAAFKQHVAEEVGSEDTRTHYDLGIAYKEMGLMDEAIGEFEIAAKSGEVTREAAIMLALCYREREETKTAAEWYRRAIDEPGGDAESVSGLRYELAEMLLGSGDVEGALKLFREVLAADPCFRDVQERVTELESSPTA